mmetsp:Transcript_7278/g.17464  ORF Transcript_7278/g.17464 Transcript_7278/m.17464 type:complete len:279 (+) Transcript_7278:495-1331(+)
MRARVSVLTRPDSRELPSNAELLHALGVDLHVVAQVSERLPRVAILAVVLPLDEPLLLAVVCAVLQHLLHLPLVVRRRHLRADLLERVGRDDKPPSAVLGAARTLPRLDELHVRHAHSPRCHEHLDVREGERRRSRLSSTASLVAAMSSLASDVHPDAFPVSCLSTRATTSQHCEGCFAGRWIGSGCADKTRRPGWSTGAAPSVREPSSMDPKRRSSEAKADAHHIDGYNAISRWTSLCILKVELLKIARCLTFSFACWSTRGALALGPYHRMLVARP